jgi:hypothetical protein
LVQEIGSAGFGSLGFKATGRGAARSSKIKLERIGTSDIYITKRKRRRRRRRNDDDEKASLSD